MKIATGMGGLEVPESIEKDFLAWCKTEGVKPDDADFELDYLLVTIDEAEGKLIPEKEAVFFANYLTQNVPAEGGYPVFREITFRVGDSHFGVIACGWTSELEDKRPLHLFVFKRSKK